MMNLRIAAVVLCLTGTAWLGMTVMHYRHQADSRKKEVERLAEVSRQQASALETLQARQHTLAELDRHHTEKLNEAEDENHALRAELARGTRRMYLAGKCTRPGGKDGHAASRSLGDDAAIGLPAETGQRILSVRQGIIRDRQKLIYLQDYIRNVCLK